MTKAQNNADGHVGDILRARGVHGEPAREAEVLEVIGEAQHRRYRVRWDDGHESIVFPADGVTITRPAQRAAQPAHGH